MPEVSIIVPVYNVEKYLKQCIDSILAQTFGDFELILVDDGSPDKCPEICDEYAKKDGRVKVIHKENGGLSSARNAGMKLACGEYILFCDSDDYVSPLWCELMLNAARSHPLSLVSCNLRKTNQDERVTFLGESSGIASEISYFDLYKRGLSCYVWNKIYRNEIFKKCGLFFDEKCFFAEDVAFIVDYYKECEGSFLLGDELYAYVQNPESIMHRYRVDLLELHLSIFRARLPIIKPDELPEYCDLWVYYITELFNNVFDKRNTQMNYFQKLSYNAKMMRFDEMVFCFENASWKNEGRLFSKVMKTHNYYLYHFFNKLIKIKNYLTKFLRGNSK